ncbi:ABC transporter permease [Olivibacter sp. XZL3]|uniref:ABC transporter permease n=1 Tax=Olivibacter sp. XZL3 TaxID=1735116 RepID=UPI0010659B06|nr:ABC transporter permease [Olivibacter sp. XZL3]
MLKSYIKTTFRYLWRNRLFTGLNVLGLAIGISACWLVCRIVIHELSYDRGISDAETIHQVISRDKGETEGGFAGVPLGLAPLLTAHAPEDVLVIPTYDQSFERLRIQQEDGREPLHVEDPDKIISTRSDYFKILPYKWLAGNQHTAFADPHSVVLTAKRARMYFPSLDPTDIIGKTIMADTTQFMVTGIVQDLSFPSTFQGQVFMPISTQDWTDLNWTSLWSARTLYIKTKSQASLHRLLEVAQAEYDKTGALEHAKYTNTIVFTSFAIPNKHFMRQYDTNGSSTDKKVLYGLMAIGGFLLLLACINYINLSTALIPHRTKEIGIRKTLGAKPTYLTANFLIETLTVTLFALFISWPLVSLFQKGFPTLMPDNLSDFNAYGILALFLVGLSLLITLVSGSYPAYLINRVRSIETLKKGTAAKKGGNRLSLRKSLIVFQFVIAQFFIISALIIGQQLNFTLNTDLGFAHDAVINMQMPYKSYQNSDVNPFLYKRALLKHPEIAGVSLGHEPLNNSHWGSIYYFNGDTGRVKFTTPRKYIDEDYLAVYQIPLLAGRNIHATDTMREVLINETALNALGLTSPAQAIDQSLVGTNNEMLTIVGVFKDFNQKSLRTKIEPLLLGSSNKRGHLQTFNIKLPNDRNRWSRSLAVMKKEWATIYPNAPFEYSFNDDRIKNLYETEYRTSKLIGLATSVTILISCLGLFGLVTLAAFQRSKEIGIRKVLGATISNIVTLLSKDFVKLVLIALLLAAPIAWWMMNKWLEDFAYRIDIKWWMFAIAGLGTVVIALLTVGYQAVKAALANPVESLRNE